MTKYEKVKDITTEKYFEGNQFAIDAFNKKYRVAKSETYVQALKRVCDYIASCEKTDELRTYWSERWFDEIYNDWWHPSGSIMQGSNSGKNISLANCFSIDTEFITDKGTKSFADFSENDTVNVLTNMGGWKPANIKKYGKNKLFKLVLSRGNNKKEIYCTDNHVWNILYKQSQIILKETKNLVVGDRIPYVKRKIVNNAKDIYYCPLGFIHGLVYGDGSYDKLNDSCNLTLIGEKKKYSEKFKGFNWKIKTGYKGYTKITRLPNYMKKLPDINIINDEYLLGFLIGWFAADGSFCKNGSATISSSNLNSLLFFKSAGEKLGIYSNIPRMIREINPYNGSRAPSYELRLITDCLFADLFVKASHTEKYNIYINNRKTNNEKVNWKVDSVEETDRIEDVWCVEEPDTHNFVLSGGILTHNCTTSSLGTGTDNEEWDSLEGIIRNAAYNVSKMAAYRQGLGLDFSKLRPSKMSVNNSSNETISAIHWMKLIDSLGNYIGQKGRIPAMLFSLSCDHPDIEEFIKVKSDYSNIQNANISVQCTDKFYSAVEKDLDWELRFDIPENHIGDKIYVDSSSIGGLGYEYDEEKKKWYYICKKYRPSESIVKIVKARDLMKLIAKNMFLHAEPGIQNIDTARYYSNSDYVYDNNDEYDSRIVSSNACQPDFAEVLTKNGPTQIKNINIGDIIWSGYSWTTIINKWKVARRQVFEYKTEKGSFIGTSDHRVLSGGRKVTVNTTGYIDSFDETTKSYKQYEILSIQYLGDYDVYDITVDDERHTYITNGCLVSNCSEQYLSNSSLCILGSINLGRFSADLIELDKELSIISPSINRFLDNVNEMELIGNTYATPLQKIAIEKLRRTGAGFTNMSAWLFKNNVGYGSLEGNLLMEEVMKKYNYYLYKSSIELGKEKGSFGLFNREKYEQSPFVKKMMKLGLQFETMRNVTCSSIAPTGTLSLMFRGTVLSYGIEPPFDLAYWKRTRMNGKYEYYFCIPSVVKNIFLDHGITLCEGTTIKDTWDGKYGKKILEIINNNRHIISNFKKSTDIDPLQKMDLMAGISKWCDSSISVTYLLPEKTTIDEVYEFIMEAHRVGLKSIAAFPDKQMYGIISFLPFKDLAISLVKNGYQINSSNLSPEELSVLNKSTSVVTESDESITKTIAPKRPKSLNCDVHHIKFTKKPENKSYDYCVFVGLIKNEPYEVFVMNNGTLPKKYTSGVLTKEKTGVYSVSFSDGTYIDDITKTSTESEDIFTRMTSTSLRHGADIKYVVEQLEKSEGDMWSFGKAMARALKKYIPNGTKIKGECPICGGALIRNDGCKTCSVCEWSACS